MLKSILFHVTPRLQKLSNIAGACGFILIVGYILVSMILELLDVEIDQSLVVDGFGPSILIAFFTYVVCMLLHMMIKTSSVQIEAQITVEGQKLTEAQSKSVRIALRDLSNAGQLNTPGAERAHTYAPRAAEVLKLIMPK